MSAQSDSVSAAPTLSSLPLELLTQISLLLDRQDALSLARVSSQFTAPAEIRIFRDIDLSLPYHYGRLPVIQPYAEAHTESHFLWVKSQQKWTELRHMEGIRKKVGRILELVDERGNGLVERVHLIPRPSATKGMVQVLDKVSSTLRSLEIEAPPVRQVAAFWHPQQRHDNETLDIRYLSAGISFPLLTHLRAHKSSLYFIGTIPLLCAAAPNLLSLDINASSAGAPPDRFRNRFPTFIRPTKIIALRISFYLEHHGDTIILDLLRNIPLVRRLSLEYQYIHDADPRHLLMSRIIESYQDMADFYPSAYPSPFLPEYDEDMLRDEDEDGKAELDRVVLRRVQRYTMKGDDWSDVFGLWPDIPSAQVLCIDCPPDPQSPPFTLSLPSKTADDSVALAMPMTLGIKLLRSCHLHTIHTSFGSIDSGDLGVFDRLDNLDVGEITGLVHSINHGTSTLIHARFYSYYYEIGDVSIQDHGNDLEADTIVEYMTWNEEEGETFRARLFERRDQPHWLHYTSWRRWTVPLEIIKQMRVVEGMSELEWDRRGVRVGAETWKVLTDWDERENEGKAGCGILSAEEDSDVG